MPEKTDMPAADAGPVDCDVGRPAPERDVFDYEPGDEDWLDDEPECPVCGGDGMDPMSDYALPCPQCGHWE
jgi:hypothetical protein